MAVISEYEEEEPVQTTKAEAPAEVQEIRLTPGTVTPPAEAADKQHDAVLSTLLVEHNQQPLQLLTTVIDYLFRETDLVQDERVESRVSEIVGAAKKRRREADAKDAAAEKMAKIEKQLKEQEKEKEVVVDLNEAPEDVEEVNIASSPVTESEPEPEPAVDVKEDAVPGVDDYDEKIDGKGLSTSPPSILSLSLFYESFTCLRFAIESTCDYSSSFSRGRVRTQIDMQSVGVKLRV
jgi:hypothetical protein